MLRLAGVGGFVLLTGLAAQIEVRLPPYGIPLSLQTLAVVMAALCLGPRFGMLAMLLYYVIGMLGVPLFAEGTSGVITTMGQTGGYLVGFILCQPVITRAVRRSDGRVRGWLGFTMGVLGGHLVVFAVGVPWLYLSRKHWLGDPIALGDAVHYGFAVYIIPMLIKTGMAVMLGRLAAPWAMKRVW